MSLPDTLRGEWAQYCKRRGDLAERALKAALDRDGPGSAAPTSPQQWARQTDSAHVRGEELAAARRWRDRERAATRGLFLLREEDHRDVAFCLDATAKRIRREAMRDGGIYLTDQA
jgi:hypothetical protein